MLFHDEDCCAEVSTPFDTKYTRLAVVPNPRFYPSFDFYADGVKIESAEMFDYLRFNNKELHAHARAKTLAQFADGTMNSAVATEFIENEVIAAHLEPRPNFFAMQFVVDAISSTTVHLTTTDVGKWIGRGGATIRAIEKFLGKKFVVRDGTPDVAAYRKSLYAYRRVAVS